MSFFDKVKTQASTLGNSISSTTLRVSGDLLTSTKENAKLIGLKSEIASIEGELDIAYREIGKMYVEHLSKTGEYFEIGTKATLKRIEPKLDKKQQLENEVIEIEKALKDQILMQEQANFQREYEDAKEKLDKALKMDIITELEYHEKLSAAKEKLDNFDVIRKIKKQFEMQLISEDEMNLKLVSLGVKL